MNKSQHFVFLSKNLSIKKRSNSNFWQATITLRKSKIVLRKSTKTSDLNEATEAAYKLLYEYEAKQANNLPITTRKFKAIAEEVKQQLQTEIDNNTAKVIYKDYISVIKNYLIPFFGTLNINACECELDNFASYRLAKQKRNTISKSTVKTHNAALNKIFALAKQQNYIFKIPKLKNNGIKVQARDAFSEHEYNSIINKLRHWHTKVNTKANKNKTTMMRALLYDYVLFIANSGMRHGTETNNLKWKDFSFFKDSKTKQLCIRIKLQKGKVGKRNLIVRNVAAKYLERIKNRDAELTRYSLKELFNLKVNKYVFRLADGTKASTANFSEAFKYFLKQNNLALMPLYCFRHTYATLQIAKGLPTNFVANNMGTSEQMLKTHYNHSTVEMNASLLSR